MVMKISVCNGEMVKKPTKKIAEHYENKAESANSEAEKHNYLQHAEHWNKEYNKK